MHRQNVPRRRFLTRLLATAVAGLAGLAATACGGGAPAATGSSPPASTRSGLTVVTPASLTLQGCTYVLDNTIPEGEPQGVRPGFAPFTPSPSAVAALERIEAKGGVAMVDSVTLPSGIDLLAGPSTGAPKVGTIPPAQSILTSEPVVWTDASGHRWLAFFLACGGNSLYWVGVDDIARQNPGAGTTISTQIAQLEKAAPYTKTGQASLLPIVVNSHHHLVFADAAVSFSIGRAELFESA